MQVPEWSVFDRLDQVELTANDSQRIGLFAFTLAFVSAGQRSPKTCRKAKDQSLSILKKWGVSNNVYAWLEEFMNEACDMIEEGSVHRPQTTYDRG